MRQTLQHVVELPNYLMRLRTFQETFMLFPNINCCDCNWKGANSLHTKWSSFTKCMHEMDGIDENSVLKWCDWNGSNCAIVIREGRGVAESTKTWQWEKERKWWRQKEKNRLREKERNWRKKRGMKENNTRKTQERCRGDMCKGCQPWN